MTTAQQQATAPTQRVLPHIIQSPWADIAVYGAELVSEKFLTVIARLLEGVEELVENDPGIRCIIFRDDNRPEGRQAAATVDCGTVSFNLIEIFSQALNDGIDQPKNSIWANYWCHLILDILHEADHHQRINRDGWPTDEEGKQVYESMAENFAFDAMLNAAASGMDLEPPHHTKDAFFLNQLREMSEGLEGDFVEHQYTMLDNCLMYYDRDGDITFRRFKDICMILDDVQDPDGTRWADSGFAASTASLKTKSEEPVTVTRRPANNDIPKAHEDDVNVATVLPATTHWLVKAEGMDMDTASTMVGKAYSEMIKNNPTPSLAQLKQFITMGRGLANAMAHQGKPEPTVEVIEQSVAQNNSDAADAAYAEMPPEAMMEEPNWDEPDNVMDPMLADEPTTGSPGSPGSPNIHPNGAPVQQQATVAAAIQQEYAPVQQTHEPARGADPVTLPSTGLTGDQTMQIAFGVFNKIFDRMFSPVEQGGCGQLVGQDLLNSGKPFLCGKNAIDIPIELTPEEQTVVIGYKGFDDRGWFQPQHNTSASGKIRGMVTKELEMPMYELIINVDGRRIVRRLLPQNPNKPGSFDGYTKPASQARGGAKIMYVIDAEKTGVDSYGWKRRDNAWLRPEDRF